MYYICNVSIIYKYIYITYNIHPIHKLACKKWMEILKQENQNHNLRSFKPRESVGGRTWETPAGAMVSASTFTRAVGNEMSIM